jgi:hypothetical protein
MTHRLALVVLASLSIGCQRLLDAVSPHEREEAPVAPIAPVAPVVPPVAPVASPVPGTEGSAPAAAALLIGAYELTWLADDATSPIEPIPETLLAQMPGCEWGRWTFVFGADGSLVMSNELLCRGGDIAAGYGVCRAEAETAVAWESDGFRFIAPVHARGRVTHYPAVRSTDDYDRTSVNCTIGHGAGKLVMTDLVTGAEPTRPQELTLVLEGGVKQHLRAIGNEEVDHIALILALQR